MLGIEECFELYEMEANGDMVLVLVLVLVTRDIFVVYVVEVVELVERFMSVGTSSVHLVNISFQFLCFFVIYVVCNLFVIYVVIFIYFTIKLYV